MALRGNLRDFSLPDVFQLVTLSGKTGVLRIKRDDAEGSVWFRDGEIFFAQSDWHREPLGTRLVAAGKITPSALSKALEVQKGEGADGRRLGQILQDEGYITDKVLEAFVQEQIQDTIFDLFRWDSGDFDFEQLESPPVEDIGLSVSIENVVMEGSRRLEEWNRIKKKIPSMGIVFKMATAPGEGTFDISLKPAEWNLLLKVDGTRSVEELARDFDRTDFEVARVIYGLFSAGLLEVATDEEAEKLRAERAELESRIAKMDEARAAEGETAKTAALERETQAVAEAEARSAAAEAAAPAVEEPAPTAAPAEEAAEAEHVTEEPAFLSAPEAANAEDMAVFEEMMGAVLQTPAEAPPEVEPQPAVEVEPEPVAEPEAAVELQPAEPEAVVEPRPVAEPEAAAEAVGLPEPGLEEAPAPPVAEVAGTPYVTEVIEGTPYVAEVVEPEALEPEGIGPEALAAELAGIAAPEVEEAEAGPAWVPEAEVSGELAEGAEAAPSGDFQADLMALGLGELPAGEDLLAPVGPVDEGTPVGEPPLPVSEDELTIAEIEALAAAAEAGSGEAVAAPPETVEVAEAEAESVSVGDLEPEALILPAEVVEAEEATETAPEPPSDLVVEPASIAGTAEELPGTEDLTELLSSLEAEADTTEVLDTSAVGLDLGEEMIEAPTPHEAPSGGVISTDAFLADFRGGDAAFGSTMTDELTALTGGGRQRPQASAKKIPEPVEGAPALHRDQHVDKDLVEKIIEGVKKL
jgi:hypothetical protein